MALQKSNQLVESLFSDMTPATRSYASPATLVRDMLPCLLEIIKPKLRPVNTLLYTKCEKDNLRNLIAILLAYNLNFVQEKSQV
jgi:chromosome transmission fidelity protein 18